uniref:HECT domain-containing protein n=1 Tax=Meloidogyne hapla TaxID=6305 RepID=A0A1I8BTM1_MELHA
MAENAQLLKRLDPYDYFKKFLIEGVYPEGRAINSFRDTLIECKGSVSDCQSSVYVQQGGTCVSCNVKLSLGPDSDDSIFKWEVEAMESVPKDLLEHSQAHLRVLLGSGSRLISPEQLVVFTLNEGKNSKKFQLRWTLNLKIMVRIVEPERQNKPLKLEKILAYLPFLLCTIENQEKKQRFLLCDPPADLCKLYNKDFCEIIIGPNGNINLLSMCCSPSFSKSYSNEIDEELLNEVNKQLLKKFVVSVLAERL